MSNVGRGPSGAPLIGTGNTTTPTFAALGTLSGLTQHGLVIAQNLGAFTAMAAGTAGQIVQSGGGLGDPAYSTSTYPSTNAINTLLYASSANVMAALATANNGVLITGATGIPSWLADGTTGQILTATTGAPPSWVSPATSGTVTSVSVVSANGFAGTVATATTTPAITLTTTATGVLSGNGTAITGSAVTQYDVLVGGASNAISSVGPGSAGQVLQSSGNAANPAYSTATYPATTTINQILYSSSANVVGGLATANNGILITGATGIPSWLADGTTGQILTATTGSPASWQNVAASSITLTGDSGGALTGSSFNLFGRSGTKISGSGSTFTFKSPPYADAGSSTTSTLNSGSFVTAAITLTLPASAGLADGDLFEYVCTTAAALIIQAVGAQKIRIGSLISSAAGTATSSNIGDAVILRFRAADGFFYALSSIGVWVMA